MEIDDLFFQTTDFEIHKDEIIGGGSYGEVFSASKNGSDKQYAAKILRSTNNFDGQGQMMFLRESIILHKLKHPLILKLEGINFKSTPKSDKIEPTIITAFLPNGSLRSNLDRGHLDNTKKYIALLGISNAMSYLHKNNIIHRDLKSENILMDENFRPIVSDFGLSKCFSDDLDDKQLIASVSFGTPIYMAPELSDSETYDKSVDVYSFAIIMYEIVTGKKPYHELGAITPFKLWEKVKKGGRPKFDDEDDVNEKMKNLISVCWSPNPDERPTFKEIFNLLSNDFSYVKSEEMNTEEIKKFIDELNENNEEEEKKNEEEVENNEEKEKKERKKVIEEYDENNEEEEKKVIEIDEEEDDDDQTAIVDYKDNVKYKIYTKGCKAEIIEMENVKSKTFTIQPYMRFGHVKYIIKKICNNALENSNIQKLILNKDINELDDLWCQGAKQLKEIDVDPRNINFRKNEDGTLTTKDDSTSKKIIYFYSKNLKGKFTIPNDIKKIGDFSFSNHEGITNLISKSSSIETIGSYAFYNCINLQTVSIEQETSNLKLGCSCFSNLLNLKYFEVSCGEFESEEDSFCSSNLTEFKILKSKTVKFHPKSFNNCANLMKFSISKSDEVAIIKDLLQYSKLEDVLLNSVKNVTLDKEAFKDFQNLKVVSITESEKINIGEECFSCSNLISIILCANSIKLGQNFVRNCSLLKEVIIKSKDDITISTDTFKLSQINKITLHAKKLKLCSNCFEGLEKLETIEINCTEFEISICDEYFNCQSLKSISLICDKSLSLTKFAFKGTSFEDITIKSNNELIINDEFLNGSSSLKKLNLRGRKSVKIGNSCFNDCTSLEFFTIDESNNICIGDNGFVNCPKITAIALKSTIKSEFGQNCFSGATNLNDFHLEGGDFILTNNCFQLCSSLKRLFLLKLGKITIGALQLSKLESLQNVVIESKEEIKLGRECFGDSKNLETVSLKSKSVTLSNNCFINCTSLTNNGFIIDAEELLIEEGAFNNCSNMINIGLKANQKLTLSEKCFAESKIESIKLDAPNVQIDKYCFSKCSSLTQFECINVLNLTLESFVFDKCFKLEQIHINIWKDLTIKDECFIGSYIKNARFNCKITKIGNNCFQNHNSITQIEICSVDVEIGKSSFEKCPNIQSIKIEASSNMTINESCFSSDKNLNSITLKGSNINIGKSCFSECKSLKNLSFESPDQIILGENAFGKCCSILNVTIPSKTVLIGKSCFSYCSSLTSVLISKSDYAKFDEQAFNECKKLKEVVVSAVKKFKAQNLCFQNNTSLRKVEINSEEISLNSYCFKKCPALSKINCPFAKTIEYHINVLNGMKERDFIECPPETNIRLTETDSDPDDHCLIY